MIEGKTKRIAPLWEGAEVALVTTKDDITAGDGDILDRVLCVYRLAASLTDRFV